MQFICLETRMILKTKFSELNMKFGSLEIGMTSKLNLESQNFIYELERPRWHSMASLRIVDILYSTGQTIVLLLAHNDPNTWTCPCISFTYMILGVHAIISRTRDTASSRSLSSHLQLDKNMIWHVLRLFEFLLLEEALYLLGTFHT